LLSLSKKCRPTYSCLFVRTREAWHTRCLELSISSRRTFLSTSSSITSVFSVQHTIKCNRNSKRQRHICTSPHRQSQHATFPFVPPSKRSHDHHPSIPSLDMATAVASSADDVEAVSCQTWAWSEWRLPPRQRPRSDEQIAAKAYTAPHRRQQAPSS
jgi:hypothetical protein